MRRGGSQAPLTGSVKDAVSPHLAVECGVKDVDLGPGHFLAV